MTDSSDQLKERFQAAADNADWQQVVMNGGPPCFRLDGNRFCLRAERWEGHGEGRYPFHKFVSLREAWQASAKEKQND